MMTGGNYDDRLSDSVSKEDVANYAGWSFSAGSAVSDRQKQMSVWVTNV